ncbi:winged helix-turn-helix domain-containing protein [Tenacibaculum piscium]|uniref:Putative transcriptional regulator n=1 Tax=Tenacibaculum piscium TaxID=1458515 RepID=A0A2H1YFC7_9FLAO|nr:transcriptional regulator [Tenacibaculum piscium]MBE7629025.1 ArsR family transcriptional regulator [Tenacibaculum piscium]MBE7670469.1 ArsR family transcriptional regulator [Tenacibaculum piscium]MBE7684954.1 ArsR family transcriptional regulator [Tenacibaculum piscium]MBE7689657.1 ArsR family transcriptional regulator [Tenacibaculum piscium]SOS74186.1 putative transcriptional regulator [Tenacibaculum piscium]
MYDNLDSILNQQIRLAVVSILIKVKKADFKYLKEQTQTTQGNLSHQLKKLKEAEYINITKTFEKNYPKTYCSLTSKGKKAFEEYVKQMKKYLNLN